MSLVLLLIGIAIGGGFAVASMVRFRQIACGLDVLLMVPISVVVSAAAFAPGLTANVFGPIALWPEGQPPPELQIAAAAALVASVFSIRTAFVGEANMLFGTLGNWGLLAFIAATPVVTTMFLMMQIALWLAWVEVNRRDRASKTVAGTRWLLWTIAADLPLAFAIVQLTGRFGNMTWPMLHEVARLSESSDFDDPTIALFVLGLLSSSAVRLALYPYSTWLPAVVGTSRVGRGLALALLSVPVGLVLLEHASLLWTLSAVAKLLAISWGPLAVIAASIVTLGATVPAARLAIASSAMLGLVVTADAYAEPVSWPAIVLTVAAIRPSWSSTSRCACGLAFGVLYAVAVTPTFNSGAFLEAAQISDRWMLEIAAMFALVAAGRATGMGRDTEATTDEVTHPTWPGLVYLALAIGLLSDNGGPGLLGLFAQLGVERVAVATAGFGVGLLSARVWNRDWSEDARIPTVVRLARRQFYIDEIVSFGIVLPARAIAQLVRFLDWAVTRWCLLAATAGVMRNLDDESRLIQRDDPPVAIALVVGMVSIAILVLAGMS